MSNMIRLFFRTSGRVPLLARRLCSVAGGEEGQEQVGGRLEQNVLRAGLRALKGDVSALKKNVEERGLALDVDKLVCYGHRYRSGVSVWVYEGMCVWEHGLPWLQVELRQQHSDLSSRIEKLRQERNINIKQFATITVGGGQLIVAHVSTTCLCSIPAE